MSNTQTATFDGLRSLANGSISASYAAVGTKLAYPARLLVITNGTNADVLISTDGSSDMLYLAQNSFKLFDLGTNRLNVDQMFVIPAGTQFYVKQVSAPSSGSVYIEVIYGVRV